MAEVTIVSILKIRHYYFWKKVQYWRYLKEVLLYLWKLYHVQYIVLFMSFSLQNYAVVEEFGCLFFLSDIYIVTILIALDANGIVLCE